MNLQEIESHLQASKKVKHKHFTPEEWLMLENGYIVFEDGCKCTPKEFWSTRTETSWLTGWSLYDN